MEKVASLRLAYLRWQHKLFALNPDRNVFTLKNIILYAVAMAAIILLLQWMQVKLLLIDHKTELYITGIAVLFTFLGIWLAKRGHRLPAGACILFSRHGHDRPPGHQPREMEVLALMATGASNQEMADQLFVSLNTIKTHTSRLFEKLDVKRRTQAIEKAKRLHLIP